MDAHLAELEEYVRQIDEVDEAADTVAKVYQAVQSRYSKFTRGAFGLADKILDLLELMARYRLLLGNDTEQCIPECDPEMPPEDAVHVWGVCYPAFVPILGWYDYATDTGPYSSPAAACRAQWFVFNPEADFEPPTVTDGYLWMFHDCNWRLNDDSSTVLPAGVEPLCPDSPAHYYPSEDLWVAPPPGIGPGAVEMCESAFYDLQHS